MAQTAREPSIRRLVREAEDELRRAGSETPRLDAELLLCHAADLTRVQLYSKADDQLDAAHHATFAELVARRVLHEPVQYILGVAHFRNVQLAVDPRVLIPRPETELLVEWVLEEVHKLRERTPSQVVRVCDVGTGSGAIAIAIMQEAPPGAVQVAATDVSDGALEVARANAAACGVAIEFFQGSLLAPVADRPFDIIVSNPPYIAREEEPQLPASVVDHEPHVALFTDDAELGGLLRELAPAALDLLRPGGLICIEIGQGQHDVAREIFTASGYVGLEQRNDLQAIVRAVGARRAGGPDAATA